MTKAFSKLPAKLRYNKNVSSSAKILWCEIYAYNIGNIYEIHNSTLATDLNLTVTHISRLIRELKANNLLLVYNISNKRKLTVIFPDYKPAKAPKEKEQKIPLALKKFWESI